MTTPPSESVVIVTSDPPGSPKDVAYRAQLDAWKADPSNPPLSSGNAPSSRLGSPNSDPARSVRSDDA